MHPRQFERTGGKSWLIFELFTYQLLGWSWHQQWGWKCCCCLPQHFLRLLRQPQALGFHQVSPCCWTPAPPLLWQSPIRTPYLKTHIVINWGRLRNAQVLTFAIIYSFLSYSEIFKSARLLSKIWLSCCKLTKFTSETFKPLEVTLIRRLPCR